MHPNVYARLGAALLLTAAVAAQNCSDNTHPITIVDNAGNALLTGTFFDVMAGTTLNNFGNVSSSAPANWNLSSPNGNDLRATYLGPSLGGAATAVINAPGLTVTRSADLHIAEGTGGVKHHPLRAIHQQRRMPATACAIVDHGVDHHAWRASWHIGRGCHLLHARIGALIHRTGRKQPHDRQGGYDAERQKSGKRHHPISG